MQDTPGITCQQHDEAVQAEGDAAMGRRPALQRLQQRPELAGRLRLRQPDRRKHALLHVAAVDAQAAACSGSCFEGYSHRDHICDALPVLTPDLHQHNTTVITMQRMHAPAPLCHPMAMGV